MIEKNKYKHINLFAVLLIFSLALIITYISIDRLYFKHTTKNLLLENALEQINVKEDYLNKFVANSQNTIASIRNNIFFKDYLIDASNKQVLNALFLSLAKSQSNIMQLRYLDKDGLEKIRVDRSDEGLEPYLIKEESLQNKHSRYYFTDSVHKPYEKVWYSELDLNIEHQKVEIPFKPVVRAMYPVAYKGEFRGVIVVNYFMKSLLERVTKLDMFDTILSDMNGYPLIHYEEQKSWGKYLAEKYNLQNKFDHTSVFQNHAYLGSEFVSKKLNLPFANKLIMIVKINDKKFNSHIASKNTEYLLVSIIVFIFSLIFGYFIARAFQALGFDLEKNKKLTQQFRSIFDNAAVGIAQNDLKGKWIRVNDKLLEIFECNFKDLENKKPLEWSHPADVKLEEQYLAQLIEGSISSYNIKKRIFTYKKNIKWVDATISMIFDEEGKKESIIAVLHDITQSVEDENILRQSAIVFENTTEGIAITDSKNKIINVNHAFEDITGYTLKEIKGKNPSILSSNRHDQKFYKQMWTSVLNQGSWSGEIFNKKKNGKIYPEWLTLNAIKNEENKTLNYIAVFSDISSFKESQEKIDILSNYDQLTGLANRQLLQARLKHFIDISQRHDYKIAILSIDLDNFKNINDSYGHSYGDSVIEIIAKRLQSLIRNEDIISRSGGDEFIIVLQDIASIDSVKTIINSLLQTIHDSIELYDTKFNITTSVGISIYPEDGTSVEILLKNSDTALFDAKRNGKNNFKFFHESMSSSSLERFSIENAINESLLNHEFELYFQPQIDLHNDKLIGFEALVRWNHPSMGFVYPDKFIPIAEETKQIIQIGEFVLEEAIKTVSYWKSLHLCGGRIAINVSGVQLEDGNFTQILQKYIKQYSVDSNNIDIEVTESAIMKNPHNWIKILNEIAELGISISIDDFGTGYSSLAYLKKFPVSLLKIDKSFVDDLPNDHDDAVIVSTIISMAQSLGIKTIAEGVETQDQKDYLKSANCDFMQGYLLSKPMSKTDTQNWLKMIKQ